MDEDVKSGNGKSRMNLWMKTRQYEELKMLAEFEGRSVSDIVRQLVGGFLRDNSETIKESKQEGSDAR